VSLTNNSTNLTKLVDVACTLPDGIFAIQGATNLTSLFISSYSPGLNEDWTVFRNLTDLNIRNRWSNPIPSKQLISICQLPSLKRLSLSNFVDFDVSHFQNLNNLISLHLSTDLTEPQILALPLLKLSSLEFCGKLQTTECLSILLQLKNLTRLSVDESEITKADVKAVLQRRDTVIEGYILPQVDNLGNLWSERSLVIDGEDF